ncbi:alpha/beta fold hydrolase [Thalassotalea ganghwensis]
MSFKVHSAQLPAHSRLLEVNQHHFHIREMGARTQAPSIVLLSGPNQHWHSDSAWFSLLQPLLAQHYHVISIDRAGNGWSSFAPNTSYQTFANNVPAIFEQLSLERVILVNFASSNLVSVFLNEQLTQLRVEAQLWIDPDILLPHSISLYSGFPANWYKEKIDDILPHIAKQNWLAKTLTRNNDQVITIESLIPKNYVNDMDWKYFNAMQQQRLTIENQQTVAIEIANYQEDLEQAAKVYSPFHQPISVIDTDFEMHDIKPDNEKYQQILTWQKEGSAWSKKIADDSQGQYYPVKNGSHLLMFQKPDLIISAIEQLIDQLGR